MLENNILVSEKQLEAVKAFFSDDIEDILYWGGARWGKSEVIGIILAICISAFPWSTWLLSRTQLADLKATTLETFRSVMKRFNYGEKSYRDKIREERHIEYVNGSRLFVIQTNLEPSDPEFDKIGSYGYTGVFLDESQQMANKLREVLSGRLSELDGSFSTEVPIEYANYREDELRHWYELILKIVVETQKDRSDIVTSKEDIKEVVLDNGKYCVVTWYHNIYIPYKLVKSEMQWMRLIHTYSWNFKGILFSSCNPWSNYTRTEFYRPYKLGQLPSYRKFIPSLVWDNPWIDRKYIERLERLPDSSIRKQRLLYGNFDFDDDPWLLYDQNTIEGMYDRVLEENSDIIYIVVDAARQGKDCTEIGIWVWLELRYIITIETWDLVVQSERIEGLMGKYGVRVNNVIVDEVGVWWGLVDMLWCKWFIGNSSPLHPYSSRFLSYKRRNYLNLRTQSFYYLQKYMSNISITVDSQDIREKITEELLTVKDKDVLNDTKLQIVSKSLMKEEIGRSPDLADMISMRMWFMIKDHHDGNEVIEDNLSQISKDDEMIQHADWLFFLEEDKQEDFAVDFDVYS